MHYQYTPSGVCSRLIDIEIDPKTMTIERVAFTGGCHGNTQGVAALVKGMNVNDVIDRLDGIQCRDKCTSCPDQLARALKSLIP